MQIEFCLLIEESGVDLTYMPDNVDNFISFHNENIQLPALTATVQKVTAFASQKNIALVDLSIEKHRMPFINWCTGLASTQI